MRHTLGSLDKVKRLVKTLGMVNAVPDFRDHPTVINGFSILMAEVFGDEAGVGIPLSVAVGMELACRAICPSRSSAFLK